MLMFAFELQRRIDANGWGLLSNAAHPGYAVTELQSTGPRIGRNGKPSIAEQIGTLLELPLPIALYCLFFDYLAARAGIGFHG